METKPKKKKRIYRNYDLTHEDIMILEEQRNKKKKRNINICDTHQDGA